MFVRKLSLGALMLLVGQQEGRLVRKSTDITGPKKFTFGLGLTQINSEKNESAKQNKNCM